jgi:hypothetical protein
MFLGVGLGAYSAGMIHLMTALPMNVPLTNLTGGAIQFSCTNPLPALQGAKSVRITYNAGVPQPTRDIQISSVQA